MYDLVDMEELLTREEVIRLLKISKATLYRLTRDGELPAIKGKRFIRYRKSDIIAFLENHTSRRGF